MLTVAGVGPGNPKYLTLEVKEKIEDAEYVLAFGRIARTLEDIRPDIVQVNRVSQVLDFIDNHKETLLLASGDPNFFGIVNFLKKEGVTIKEVLPGISSFQYMMAKLEKSWQEANFISLHGREASLEEVKNNSLSILLIDKDKMPSDISKELYEMGIRGKIYAGFDLSYDSEKIIEKYIGESIDDISPLGVVVIENEMD